jgi:hypothetical protein
MFLLTPNLCKDHFSNAIQGLDEVWYVDVHILLFYPIVAMFFVPHLHAFLILVAFHFSCFFRHPMSYNFILFFTIVVFLHFYANKPNRILLFKLARSFYFVFRFVK